MSYTFIELGNLHNWQLEICIMYHITLSFNKYIINKYKEQTFSHVLVTPKTIRDYLTPSFHFVISHRFLRLC